MRRFSAILVGMVLVASACGDDDGGGDLTSAQQELADSIAANLDVNDPEAPPGVTEDDVSCMSGRMAGAFSDARIDELGLTPERVEADDFDLGDAGLSGDEEEAVIAGVEDCIDFRPLLVESMTSGGEISDNSAECLADAFPDDFVTRALRAGFLGEEDFEGSTDDLRAVTAAMSECLTDDEFGQVVG